MNAVADFVVPRLANPGLSISAPDAAVIVQTSAIGAEASIELPGPREGVLAIARPTRPAARNFRGIPELDSPMAG